MKKPLEMPWFIQYNYYVIILFLLIEDLEKLIKLMKILQ